ncbi:sulfite exporter TauE/SafE family protein [Microbacteriaceae bacterium VKM Ac-2855]|nr:sulfite exporter TauE/SafE family protein [Microbacteriaceae bacterium VKM Ac-2855]
MDWLGVAVLLVVAVGAAAQVVTGVGFALVCAPLLLLTLGRDQGIRTVLAMSILLNVYVLLRSFRHVRIGDAARMLLPSVAFVPLTVLFAGLVRGPVLTAVAGAVIITATTIVALGRPLPFLEGNRGVYIAGAASGVFNVLAAASGPPVTLLAVQRRWSPAATRGTLQVFALGLNILTLVILGPIAGDYSQLGWAAAGLVFGTAAASLTVHRAPAHVVRPVTLAIAGVGGATLVATGVAALL